MKSLQEGSRYAALSHDEEQKTLTVRTVEYSDYSGVRFFK